MIKSYTEIKHKTLAITEYPRNPSDIDNIFNNWKKTIEKQNPDWSLVIDNIQYSVEKQLIYIFILYHLEKYE